MTATTEARTWELLIPAPANWLNANDRTDRRRETPDRQAWRYAGKTYARQARLPHLRRAHLLAELRFADALHRDVHNLYPSIKALVDGLIDYGLLPDDSYHYLVGPDLRYGPQAPKRPLGVSGEVFLTITDLGGTDAG